KPRPISLIGFPSAPMSPPATASFLRSLWARLRPGGFIGPGCRRDMRRCGLGTRALLWFSGFLVLGSCPLARGQPAPTNAPPQVSIVWPRATDDVLFRAFYLGTWLKLKAEASDPDGTVAQVQFFADNGLGTKLIGVVTNPPFNLVWLYDGFVPAKVDLTVVAVDKLSASTESAPLRTFFGDGAGFDSAVEIVSPSSGTLFAAPATFQFKAELLATTYRLAIYPV